jgi:hypothetical protein
MRMPFMRLVEEMARLTGDELDLSFGELSRRFDEPVQRLMDAAEVVKSFGGFHACGTQSCVHPSAN